jgi:hypothetical protein
MVRNCPEKKPNGSEETHLVSAAFDTFQGDFNYLSGLDGVWGILDCGATKSLGGDRALEKLNEQLQDIHGPGHMIVHQFTPNFKFGNGLFQKAVSSVQMKVLLAGQKKNIDIAVLLVDVPILIGVDILRPEEVNINFRTGIIVFPNISGDFLLPL